MSEKINLVFDESMELGEQWWKGQVVADIHQALRIKELRLPLYKSHSPQLNTRRYFADLLAIISNHFHLCPTARHLAVYLLDLFMDRYDISVQKLHLVALSCLLLASKFEEKEDRVPKLEQLNSLTCLSSMNLVLNKQDLLHMELLLLESFQWNLCLPTAAHFIDYYLSIAVHETDLHGGRPMVYLEKTKLYTEKYSAYFLEVSLQDHGFLNYFPSVVAAACIAASRAVLKLTPLWPVRLHHLTAYAWDALLPCTERLLIAHDNDVKEANKQKREQSVQIGQSTFLSQPVASSQTRIAQQTSPYLHPKHSNLLQYHHQQPLQQNCQSTLPTGQATRYTISACPSNLQANFVTHGPRQANTMSLATNMEVKSCINIPSNQKYQVNGH
ncbi:cyclin-J isoform X1 [Chiloscyllium plagiosum]|uniref:cyclin-J isoform X1 n=2 Tax=Chiloscyllium plagiosum TaxID=36176 RepID=UPI001CB7F7A4|nr:cyclin-J isoform X1 [Chiloscyllium plagiosum]